MIKINLLSEAKPTRKKRGVSALGGAGRLNLLLLFAMVLVGIVIVGVEWWVWSSKITEQDEKNRQAQAEVTRLEAVLKEVENLKSQQARVERKIDLIKKLRLDQKGPVRLMDEVSNALPDLLWLEKMEYNGNACNLEGKALNPPAVANFLVNLKLNPYFQEPKVQNITAASVGNTGAQLYSFKLSFIFSNIEKTQFDPQSPEAVAAAGDKGDKGEKAAGASGQAAGTPPKAEK